MENIYNDPTAAGSFGSPEILKRYSKRNLKDIRGWLATQDSYTLHRAVKRKFKRRITYAVAIDRLWQIDLCDVSNISRYNDNKKFILTCIDCFSRYAFAVAIKNKTAIEVKHAFEEILLSSDRRPTYVQSDKGKEFLNAIFQSFLQSVNILHYTSENDDIKCSIVERFNLTLKTRMYKYFTFTKNLRFLEILPKLVDSYNNTYHSTIKMAPNEVNRHNEADLHTVLYKHNNNNRKSKPSWKFRLNDRVRISRKVHAFEKSFIGPWSREVIVIRRQFPTSPVTYEIEDYSGQIIKGKFYEPELQFVDKNPTIFEVEKILRSRTKNGKKQYLVRWAGYDSKHDSWVDDIVT